MRLVLLLLALLIAGCATPPLPPATPDTRARGDGFSVEARFSVTAAGERSTGRLFWRHGSSADDVQISSPFGQVLAVLTLRPGLARLETAERRSFEADDADALMRDALGYDLPVTRLAAWLRGRPDLAARVLRDAGARVVLAEDAGWRIEYDYPDAAAALPARLRVTREDGFELRLRIEEWQLE